MTQVGIAARLERSSAFQELIAREIELDELWRRVETVGMGPIVDRSKEHLGAADSAVIALRRILIKAARDLESGEEPYAPYHGDAYRRRAWSAVLPRNDDFLNDPVATKMHESLVP